MSIFAQSMSASNDSVLGLLNMMSDPEAFKEKLKQLTDLQKDLEEKIALAGEAAQIVNIKKSLQEQHAKMVEAVQEADEKCKALVNEASIRANSLLTEAEKSARVIVEEATATKNIILAESARLDDANQTVCADRMAAVEKKEIELRAHEKKLEEDNYQLDLKTDELTLKEEAHAKAVLDLSHQKNVLSSELAQVREGKARIVELITDFKNELDYLVLK